MYTTDKSKNSKYFEGIIHHIITFVLCIWGFSIGIYIVPDCVKKMILFETSTIFLHIRFWIKEFLTTVNANEDTSFTKIIKNIQPINEIIFASIFIYFRCFIFIKDIIFNNDFYIKLTTSDNIFYSNKIIIFVLFIFLLLNLYWSYIILKGGYKGHFKPLFEKLTNNSNKDIELKLIDKIHTQLLFNQNKQD